MEAISVPSVTNLLSDPAHIGTSEYRAIYETIMDAVASNPDLDEQEHAIGILNMFISEAEGILAALGVENTMGFLNDREYAETIGSLQFFRDYCRQGREPKDVISALDKITRDCTPSTNGMFFRLNTPS
jgi:hypothetical protein